MIRSQTSSRSRSVRTTKSRRLSSPTRWLWPRKTKPPAAGGEIGETIIARAAIGALARDFGAGAGMKDESVDAAGADPRREAGEDETFAVRRRAPEGVDAAARAIFARGVNDAALAQPCRERAPVAALPTPAEEADREDFTIAQRNEVVDPVVACAGEAARPGEAGRRIALEHQRRRRRGSGQRQSEEETGHRPGLNGGHAKARPFRSERPAVRRGTPAG